MKKNEIRFVATENGINCEGNVVLSQADRKKVENMLDRVQNAAKDCGASLSLSPVGIQLGFNVACSCGIDTIHEAAARMKCIIEEMREFISNLEVKENHEDTPEDKVVAKEQHEAIDKFFDEMRKKYPNAKLTIVCDDNDWVAVASNMHPMHVLHCIIGAINAEKNGENQ
jgi:cob(I)alamin adenosyltransferase